VCVTTLVTGAAGFIGAALVQHLLARGETIVGIDNHNDYYDPRLKEARLQLFDAHPHYTHHRCDIADRAKMAALFDDIKPKRVVHLAAQAGVRYSLDNPQSYIDSNIVGFGNILEGCRHAKVAHLVYASSSSVYGANTSLPYSEHDHVDHPLSLYAASKKANELMAHTYSHLYDLPTTGLRFFTVYGPWGRPDMALFKFAHAMLNGQPIDVYNNGQHSRDFTYIDDVIEGVVRVLNKPAEPNVNWKSNAPDPASSRAPWRIYNIGNNTPVKLMDCIYALENALGVKANIKMHELQPGDVVDTWANIDDLTHEFHYRPRTSINEGIKAFVSWYREKRLGLAV
jgi:UDP-glucuronate 4-epimerase